MRLEPAEASVSAATTHTAAELRRVLGPEQDPSPEPAATAEAGTAAEPTTDAEHAESEVQKHRLAEPERTAGTAAPAAPAKPDDPPPGAASRST
ncbi:MAG: hypothetical protein HS113_29000 [Verrucomicrobiales bacterium]|nr:hypothetical protein [Verrucomicrobiales bacterium]